MRLQHKAGDNLFVDFAGKTIEVTNPETGETTNAQIFVATMGGSNYTYVEAVEDQKLRSWIDAHVRCLEFLQALPRVIVCDNLKAAVIRARRPKPVINKTYEDFGRYYDLILSPARVKKPQDKSAVEGAVKWITTHILTRLELRQFFSIAELNQAIRPLLNQLNNRPFQKKLGTRLSQFEELDLPAMRPLPETRYPYRECKKLKVSMNYHVYAKGGDYSVPYRYVHQTLEVWISDRLVQCFFKTKLIAQHTRLRGKGRYSTHESHLPEHHRQYQDRERILDLAKSIGPNALRLIEAILDHRKHREQSFRSVKGILGLEQRYGKERLDAACGLAWSLGEHAFNYPSLASILKYGRDQLHESPPTPPPILHENVRGGDYYAN